MVNKVFLEQYSNELTSSKQAAGKSDMHGGEVSYLQREKSLFFFGATNI